MKPNPDRASSKALRYTSMEQRNFEHAVSVLLRLALLRQIGKARDLLNETTASPSRLGGCAVWAMVISALPSKGGIILLANLFAEDEAHHPAAALPISANARGCRSPVSRCSSDG
jgi:hypothetical protein